jgi:hypothetical protein
MKKPQEERSAKLIAGARRGMSRHNLIDATTPITRHSAAVRPRRDKSNSNLATFDDCVGAQPAAPQLGKV